MNYPDYVKRFRPKGTIVKKIKDTYYVYNATSKRVPGKSYPVQVVGGIAGKIDEKGFHPVKTTRVELDEVIVRECGFTNYLLLFEDQYVAQSTTRSKKDSKSIYRSMIVYLSNNSYLNEETEVKIYSAEELVKRYGIGISQQVTMISKIIERNLSDLGPLKYICNVRAGGKVMNSMLTEEQRRILKELEIDETEIR